MKKLLILTPFLFVFSICYAQSKVLKSISMESDLLNTSVKYSVYLPNGFDSSEEKFPVIYLLNGFTGDETNWVVTGLIREIADELIRGNKIEPMVIIMPDGDDRLYMNKDDGSFPYEDMLIKEFIPFVESTYRIKSEKQFRGISVLSMGGAGSLRLSMKHPDLFGSCAAFSSAILSEAEVVYSPQASYDNYFGRVSPSAIGKKGENRITSTYKDYDVLNLAKTIDADVLKTIDIYFDCGDDDFLTIGNSLLHIEMTKRKIPHEFRMRDGAHTWNFWVESLPYGLEFISDSMRN